MKIEANGESIHFYLQHNAMYVQFASTFFMQNGPNSLAIIRQLVDELNHRINMYESRLLGSEFNNTSMIISRIDICYDIPNICPNEILLPTSDSKNEIKFSLPKPFIVGSNPIETISFRSAYYELRAYRKDIEVLSKKDPIKLKWLKENFNNQPVTRLELELKQSRTNKDTTFHFYQQKISEKDLCELALRDWHSRHRIISKKTGLDDKRWLNLFLSKDLEIKRPKTFASNLLAFNPHYKPSLKSCFNRIADSHLGELAEFSNVVQIEFQKSLDEKLERQSLKAKKAAITKNYFEQILSARMVVPVGVVEAEAIAEDETGTPGTGAGTVQNGQKAV